VQSHPVPVMSALHLMIPERLIVPQINNQKLLFVRKPC